MLVFINFVFQAVFLQLPGNADETVSQDSFYSLRGSEESEAPDLHSYLSSSLHFTRRWVSVSCCCQPSAWGVCRLSVYSSVLLMQGRLHFEFWSRARCLHSTSQLGNDSFTSGIQLLSQMILHCITTKPQGCSKHPLSANFQSHARDQKTRTHLAFSALCSQQFACPIMVGSDHICFTVLPSLA